MFILGLLAVFQITLLPGLLILPLFKSHMTLVQKLAYAFALSLLANYVVVLLLTSFGLYRRSISMGILALELGLLFWLYRGKVNFSFSARLQQSSRSLIQALRKFKQNWADYWSLFSRVAEGNPKDGEGFRSLLIGAVAFISLPLALSSIGWAFYLLVDNIGTVFNAWDAWASWDPWALDWYYNQFARNTWEYPQLIPINWSITYRFIGSEAVKFFAKSIMPLFTLLMLLLTFDLGRKRKAYGYFLGVSISFYAIYEFTGKYIGEGYVDLPVAGLSFLAIYTLLIAQDAKDWKAKREWLILGSLVSAAAAVTKQPGLAILAAYPVLAYFIVLQELAELKQGEKIRHLAWTTALAFLIVLPWYVYTVIQIRAGSYSSNIQFVTQDIYAGASLWERLQTSWEALGVYAYLYIFLLLALPFLDKAFRWITIAIIIPYSLLWGMFLSYEYRNLAIAFPLMGMVVGVGIQEVLAKINLRRIRKAILPAILIVGLLWGASLFTGGTLTKLQNDRQRNIFEPEINNKLYTYFANHDGPGVVLSPYPVGWLPGLNKFWIHTRFADYEQYKNILEERDQIEYLLIFERADEAINNEVREKIESGEYERIFVEDEYMFVDLTPDK